MTVGRLSRVKIPRMLGYITSLAALTVGVRIAGFFDKLALTAFFDLANLECLFIAISVPMMTFSVVVAVVNPIVLPGLAGKYAVGDSRGAAQQLQGWLLILLPLAGAVTGLVMLVPEHVAAVLAPGFDSGRRDLLAGLVFKLAPLNLVMSVVALLNVFLNAKREFTLPAAGELAMKAVGILCVLALAKTLGLSAPVCGVVVGAVTYLALVGIAVSRHCLPLPSSAFLREHEFKKTLVLMLAPCTGSIAARIGEIVERAAASTLAPGAVAALTLARKLVDLPLLVISLAAATVLFTYFAELNQSGDRRAVARLMDAGMRIMVMIFLPIVIVTCLLSETIVSFVYQRGEFDARAAHQVSQALFWLAPSMMLVAMEMLLMRHFFSRLDVWRPTLIGIGCVGARVGLVWPFAHWWDILGVALAVTLSRALKVAVLLFVMRRWREPAPFSRAAIDSAKIGAAGFVSAATGLAVLALMKESAAPSTVRQAVSLLCVGSAAMVAYTGSIALFWRGNLKQALFPNHALVVTDRVHVAVEENAS